MNEEQAELLDLEEDVKEDPIITLPEKQELKVETDEPELSDEIVKEKTPSVMRSKTPKSSQRSDDISPAPDTCEEIKNFPEPVKTGRAPKDYKPNDY